MYFYCLVFKRPCDIGSNVLVVIDKIFTILLENKLQVLLDDRTGWPKLQVGFVKQCYLMETNCIVKRRLESEGNKRL